MTLTRLRSVVVAVVLTAAVALSGCGVNDQVAAKVGDTVIPTSQVELLTRIQCGPLGAGQPGNEQVFPVSLIRAEAVNMLVESALYQHIVDEYDQPIHIDTEQYRASLESLDQAVPLVDEEDQAAFRELFASLYLRQFQMLAMMSQELIDAGVEEPTTEQSASMIQAAVGEISDRIDITIASNYGAGAASTAGAVDPSPSIPVSEFATKITSEDPDFAWLRTLPTALRCG